MKCFPSKPSRTTFGLKQNKQVQINWIKIVQCLSCKLVSAKAYPHTSLEVHIFNNLQA